MNNDFNLFLIARQQLTPQELRSFLRTQSERLTFEARLPIKKIKKIENRSKDYRNENTQKSID